MNDLSFDGFLAFMQSTMPLEHILEIIKFSSAGNRNA